MNNTTTTTLPQSVRLWRVSGVWEMFRVDHADIEAASQKQAKEKFRRRYKNKRSVSSISAYPLNRPAQ